MAQAKVDVRNIDINAPIAEHIAYFGCKVQRNQVGNKLKSALLIKLPSATRCQYVVRGEKPMILHSCELQ